jgi:hypothetical protein
MLFSEALEKARQELGGRTRTALAQATTAAAEQAAAQPPPPVLSTSHLRELAAAASRVFGWDNTTHQVTHNQLVITADQLRQIRMLRETSEQPVESLAEVKERIGRLGTIEGQQELRRTASEWLGCAQNVEQPKVSPTPSAPEIYEVTIRGDGGGVKTKP